MEVRKEGIKEGRGGKARKKRKKLMCLDILTTPYFPKYDFWA